MFKTATFLTKQGLKIVVELKVRSKRLAQFVESQERKTMNKILKLSLAAIIILFYSSNIFNSNPSCGLYGIPYNFTNKTSKTLNNGVFNCNIDPNDANNFKGYQFIQSNKATWLQPNTTTQPLLGLFCQGAKASTTAKGWRFAIGALDASQKQFYAQFDNVDVGWFADNNGFICSNANITLTEDSSGNVALTVDKTNKTYTTKWTTTKPTGNWSYYIK